MPPKNSTKSKKEDESDDEIVLSKRSEKGEVKHVRTSSSAASTPSSKSKDKKKHKHKKQAENDDSQSDNENKMDVDEPAKGSSGPAKATKYSAGENDEASFDDALGDAPVEKTVTSFKGPITAQDANDDDVELWCFAVPAALDISSLNGRTVSVVRPAGADGPTIYNFDKLCRPSETSKSHLSFREEGTVASDSLVALFPDRANNKLSFGKPFARLVKVVEVADEVKQEKKDTTLKATPTEHLPDASRLKNAPVDWKVTPLLSLPPKEEVSYKVRWGQPGSDAYAKKPKAIPEALLQKHRKAIDSSIGVPMDTPSKSRSSKSETPAKSSSKGSTTQTSTPKSSKSNNDNASTPKSEKKSSKNEKGKDSEKKRKRSPSPTPDKKKKAKTSETPSK